MQRLSSEQIKELKQLKAQILSGIGAIEELAAQARAKANAAVAEGLLVGNALCRAKQIGGADWLALFDKGVSVEAARSYMRLAKHGADLLTTDGGLRRAYDALGIFESKGGIDGSRN